MYISQNCWHHGRERRNLLSDIITLYSSALRNSIIFLLMINNVTKVVGLWPQVTYRSCFAMTLLKDLPGNTMVILRISVIHTQGKALYWDTIGWWSAYGFHNKTLSVEDNAWLPSCGLEEPCTDLQSWPTLWLLCDFELYEFRCWCQAGWSENFTKRRFSYFS